MLAFRSVMSSRIPMVIILGATGTGKTKLGVELAQNFKTEIISADSMQIYKGLDIVTAKASLKEQESARHHLLDILEPHQIFTVVDFRSRALKIIENLLEQEKIPIIVGGTNYYVESIVYSILVEHTDDTEVLLWDKSRRKRDIEDDTEEAKPQKLAKESDVDFSSQFEDVTQIKGEAEEELTKENVQKFVDNERKYSSEEIHNKLKAIDPNMASRHHPNNRRKVLRAGCSTVTAMLDVVDNILLEQDNGHGTMRTLLDFSRAFDYINIPLLLAKPVKHIMTVNLY